MKLREMMSQHEEGTNMISALLTSTAAPTFWLLCAESGLKEAADWYAKGNWSCRDAVVAASEHILLSEAMKPAKTFVTNDKNLVAKWAAHGHLCVLKIREVGFEPYPDREGGRIVEGGSGFHLLTIERCGEETSEAPVTINIKDFLK